MLWMRVIFDWQKTNLACEYVTWPIWKQSTITSLMICITWQQKLANRWPNYCKDVRIRSVSGTGWYSELEKVHKLLRMMSFSSFTQSKPLEVKVKTKGKNHWRPVNKSLWVQHMFPHVLYRHGRLKKPTHLLQVMESWEDGKMNRQMNGLVGRWIDGWMDWVVNVWKDSSFR